MDDNLVSGDRELAQSLGLLDGEVEVDTLPHVVPGDARSGSQKSLNGTRAAQGGLGSRALVIADFNLAAPSRKSLSGSEPVSTGVPQVESGTTGKASDVSGRSSQISPVSSGVEDHSHPAPISNSADHSSTNVPLASGSNNRDATTVATDGSGQASGSLPCKRGQDFDAIEDVVERRRQRRMAKNRATAAKSRERKRAQFTGMNDRLGQLEAHNAALQQTLLLRDAEISQMRSELELSRASSMQGAGSGSLSRGVSGQMQTSQSSQGGNGSSGVAWGQGQGVPHSSQVPAQQVCRNSLGERERAAGAWSNPGNQYGSLPLPNLVQSAHMSMAPGVSGAGLPWHPGSPPGQGQDHRSFLASPGQLQQKHFPTEQGQSPFNQPAQAGLGTWTYGNTQQRQAVTSSQDQNAVQQVILQQAPQRTAVYQTPNSQALGNMQAGNSNEAAAQGYQNAVGQHQDSERSGSGMVGLDDGLVQYFWEHQDQDQEGGGEPGSK